MDFFLNIESRGECKLPSLQEQEGKRMYDKLPLTPTQQGAVKQLIQKECCNYDHGLCLQTDRPCAQIRSNSLTCDWFYTAVMPLDEGLKRDIAKLRGEATKSAPMPDAKQCILCGRDFQPGSNRAKYCKSCASSVIRERKREDQRRRRAG